jgi:hypothetical protein
MLYLLMMQSSYDKEWRPDSIFEDISEARAEAKELSEYFGNEVMIEEVPFWAAGEYFKYKERERERQQRANHLNSESLRNALNKSAKAVQELPTYDFSGVEMVE